MVQFDVYLNPNEASRGFFLYIMDITNPLHSASSLRVVIPLCNDGAAVRHLNPKFTIDGEKLYLSVMDIAGVPASLCTDPVANLSDCVRILSMQWIL